MVVVSQSGAVGTTAVVSSQPQQPQPHVPPGVLMSDAEHFIPAQLFCHFLFVSPTVWVLAQYLIVMCSGGNVLDVLKSVAVWLKNRKLGLIVLT
jgi:hypothetical protein